MLKRLHISNFALINEMDVAFPGKLTVITGETGAGKSIFLEALALVLGKRAEANVLKNKNKKCIIEAEFDVRNLDLSSFFEEFELDADANIILRREISAEGKSRSFLNDSVVSLAALKNLSEKIIDIHSQHQTLLLNQGNFQLDLVDAFAGSSDLFKGYKSTYALLIKARKQHEMLLQEEAEARKQLDYHQFLFSELEEAALKTGQMLQLEQESAALENAESIQMHLLQAAQGLTGGEENLLIALARIRQNIQEAAKYDPQYKELAERIQSCYIELKELGKDLDDAGSSVHSNENRLSEINTQLDKYNHLLRKHQVKTEEGLIKIKAELEQTLLNFSSLEDQISKIEKELKEHQNACLKIAKDLSSRRNTCLSALENEVMGILKNLSMENAQFKIEMQTLAEIGGAGLDQVKFLFSANKGIGLNDLSKIASGGELSRLMLSLKAIMADKKQLPSIIFDEIDTGVSGDVAEKIGSILLKMGERMQVVTITHLPQMASKGSHHLFVYKNDDEEATVSHIRQLNKEERVVEIAKMLSTGNPTTSALKNAKELLSL